MRLFPPIGGLVVGKNRTLMLDKLKQQYIEADKYIIKIGMINYAWCHKTY